MTTDDSELEFSNMKRRYLERRNEDLLKLEECLKDSDFLNAKFIAHRIKGTAVSYGFPEMGEWAERLDRSLRESGEEMSKEKLESELKLFKEILESLDEIEN
ncbi:Hpt domain-containing protein [bacterium]|nr:Hpt domain-containing protein [bacterium]